MAMKVYCFAEKKLIRLEYVWTCRVNSEIQSLAQTGGGGCVVSVQIVK